MSKNKKTVTIRFEPTFIQWLDIRAEAERLTRTALLEKLGWDYLRANFDEDQNRLETINRVLGS